MNTVFLRLESHLQAWRTGERFYCRETSPYPTKSGVIGLTCASLGVRRKNCKDTISRLNRLKMGVRVDRPGVIIRDYHTTSNLPRADRGTVAETSETLRDFISDGSFLVSLHGESEIIKEVVSGLENPKFSTYLGAKCCIPSKKILAGTGDYYDLTSSLSSPPWLSRGDQAPKAVTAIVEVVTGGHIVNDVLTGLEPITHSTRMVESKLIPVTNEINDRTSERSHGPSQKAKDARFENDNYLCVVCQLPAEESHHVTYERVGDEQIEDLRSLCKRCHNAVTAIEYELDMKRNRRLDPLLPEWRAKILKCRDTILKGKI